MTGISSGTTGSRAPARSAVEDSTTQTIPASTSRSTASTSRWSSMKPSSTSSERYSARWRTVSCGSARNTGPTSYTRSKTPTSCCL